MAKTTIIVILAIVSACLAFDDGSYEMSPQETPLFRPPRSLGYLISDIVNGAARGYRQYPYGSSYYRPGYQNYPYGSYGGYQNGGYGGYQNGGYGGYQNGGYGGYGGYGSYGGYPYGGGYQPYRYY